VSATLVRGPDYSNWQPNVDLASVRAAGHLIVGLKATEGTGFTDRMFATRWRTAERVGLGRLAYHFAHADFGSSPEAQAYHFMVAVKAAGGWHPWDIPVLDIEAGNLSGAALDAWIDRWCRSVEKHWRPGLIYSGGWYLGAKGARTSGPRSRGWQLWTSAYGSRPTVFGGFTNWRLWQHTDGKFGPTPHRSGKNGNSDMNIANGPLESWTAWTHHRVKGVTPHKYAGRRLDLGMRGTDVERLQRAVNHRLHARGKKSIVSDGIYGPATETAVHFVKYSLGLPLVECNKRGCSTRAQIVIDNPKKRRASDLARAVYRAK
jgi:GH25 family lysozyme M1 (1,4-beta-N-acetylmuramidase)